MGQVVIRWIALRRIVIAPSEQYSSQREAFFKKRHPCVRNFVSIPARDCPFDFKLQRSQESCAKIEIARTADTNFHFLRFRVVFESSSRLPSILPFYAVRKNFKNYYQWPMLRKIIPCEHKFVYLQGSYWHILFLYTGDFAKKLLEEVSCDPANMNTYKIHPYIVCGWMYRILSNRPIFTSL